MKSSRGFTLIELLIAIAIFAVLSALGWQIFDYLVKVKTRNATYETQLFELQEAYQQVFRDSLQVVAVPAILNNQVQSALVVNNNFLGLSKSGVTDPLKQGLAPFERIEYRFNNDTHTLSRYRYSNLRPLGQLDPQVSVILHHVQSLEIVALNPDPVQIWPDPATPTEQNLTDLPRGIRLKIRISDVDYEWIYALNSIARTAN